MWRDKGNRPGPKPRPVRDRFMAHVARPEDAHVKCWEWQGAKDGTGYGKLWDGKRLSPAHRVAYELFVGPIPSGLQIDHLCRNRACVNPAHLEPVTCRENILRGVGLSAVNAKKTQCLRGHSEWYVWRGERHCKVCRLVRNREFTAMRRAK